MGDDNKVVTKAAPTFFYYAMFDGTLEVDSVAFGRDLDARGGVTNWRNLLDLLDRDPNDRARLVDPDHAFLPIYKLDAQGQKDGANGIAVVCPLGQGSAGVDDIWQGYGGAAGVAFPDLASMKRGTLFGRHAAAEQSARFMNDFFLEPVVAVDRASGTKRIASGNARAAGERFRASLLYVSSHGWLGGFSRGNMLPSYSAARPAGNTDDDPTKEYVPVAPYFAIGAIDAGGKAFAGPEWIVLAQCSTTNVNTWSMWARVMARSAPQVRGILGYEEASPEAGTAARIADAFFDKLKSKASFYDAWRAANAGQNWAALVHKDAVKDTLQGWATRPPLAGRDIADYLGSASRAPNPVAVTDPPLPCTVRLHHARSGRSWEITPAVLDKPVAALLTGSQYVVDVEIGAGKTVSQVKVEWIHIRDTFQQANRAKVFPTVSALSMDRQPGTVSLRDPRVVVAEFSPPVARALVVFTAGSEAELASSGLAAHHSYLWPRVTVTGTGLSNERMDVKTRGVNYFG